MSVYEFYERDHTRNFRVLVFGYNSEGFKNELCL